MAVRAPSVEQIEVRHGAQCATVVEVGGALRAYEAAGIDILDGYPVEARCTNARGQSLIPWPNRVAGGAYTFDGEEHQLPLSEPAAGNAIHGLVRWANWHVGERTADRVTMKHVLPPQSGYPFALALAIDYALDDEGLTVRTTARNIGARPAPVGFGAHPYLKVGCPRVDELTVRAPGRTWLPVDGHGIPTGEEPPVDGTPYDFTTARPVGDARLDTGFGDLARGPDGRARVEITAPGVAAATMWLDEAHGWLMLFTADPLPEPERRRSLGVEPMTCAPNALRTGKGLRRLEPGDAFSAAWGITPG
jgi:aldose 1-epimerase